MGTKLKAWDFNDTTQWLRPVDLHLATQLLARTQPTPGRSILEIGVWKGAWLLQLVAMQADVVGVGVDPYPGSPGMREQVLDLAAAKGIEDRTILVPALQGVCARLCTTDAHHSFALSHIDGLHVEQQVELDLRYAARHSAPDGVIIVDDYLHPAYPGIASAMYRFLADRQFAMFLTTGNKAYVCRADAHGAWHSATERILDESGLVWMRYKGEHATVRYVQRPDVAGFEVLLCLDPRNDSKVLAGLHPPVRLTVRRFADRWIPTGARERARPIKHGANHMLRGNRGRHRRRAQHPQG